jgi:hypothetical protein
MLCLGKERLGRVSLHLVQSGKTHESRAMNTTPEARQRTRQPVLRVAGVQSPARILGDPTIDPWRWHAL